MLYQLSYRAKWRSRRELNPRSLPWQGSVLNHFTTGPWLRKLDLNQWPSGYEPDELPAALFRDIMAGNEGFEPPRAVKPLVVFKTTPFSLLGNCPWWTQQDSNLWPTGYEPVALTNWAMGPNQTLLSSFIWWHRRESNSWPSGYEPDALTNWATVPNGGEEGTRTLYLLRARQALWPGELPPHKMVKKTGFEPATTWSQTKRSTKLSYFSLAINASIIIYKFLQNTIKKSNF